MLKITREEIREAIRKLFKCILGDLKIGVDIKKAGWRHPEEIGLREDILKALSQFGPVLDRDLEGRVRIAIKNQNILKKLLSQYNLDILLEQLKYFQEVQTDIAKDQERIKMLSSISNEFREMLLNLKNNGELQYAIALGLWRMLSLCEFPVSLDAVLSEGLSPSRWIIISARAVPYLAVELAQGVGKIESIDAVLEFAKKHGLLNIILDRPLLNSEELSESYQKIRKILRWDLLKQLCPKELIAFLGLAWFLEILRESKDLLLESGYYSEEEIHNAMIKIVEETLQIPFARALKLLEETYEQFKKCIEGSIHSDVIPAGILNLREVLVFPWGFE